MLAGDCGDAVAMTRSGRSVLGQIVFTVLGIAIVCASVAYRARKPKVDLLPAPPAPIFTDSTFISSATITWSNSSLFVADRDGLICQVPPSGDETNLSLARDRTWEECARMLMWVQLGEIKERDAKARENGKAPKERFTDSRSISELVSGHPLIPIGGHSYRVGDCVAFNSKGQVISEAMPCSETPKRKARPKPLLGAVRY